MAKRKFDQGNDELHDHSHTHTAQTTNGISSKIAKTNGHIDVKTSESGPVIQIITGSYERVLHGITASISDLSSSPSKTTAQFADTFLFNAHASAIKCIALSPLPDQHASDSQGVYLATGGTDEKVNVYSLAAAPLADSDRLPAMPVLGNSKVTENPRNRELGTLLQHASNITALHFPNRSKLLSGSEDNTISISRVRDLTTVSTVKAPRPKVQGQPSGDTAPPGATPAGINDFAVHPSMKLMVSVGRGERCMRLWNLVTGKKAGVLNFSREDLQTVKEGKYSSGEGRKICWSQDGTEFAVAFERGVLVFGEDSTPKCSLCPMPLTKVHQIAWVPGLPEVLAVSTEDGRIVFYHTQVAEASKEQTGIQAAKVVGQLGGKEIGLPGRIKDFEVLRVTPDAKSTSDAIVITAGSDGAVRLWAMNLQDLLPKTPKKDMQLGQLVGTHETASRITCLRAFVMLPEVPEDIGLSEFEGISGEDEDEDSDSDEE